MRGSNCTYADGTEHILLFFAHTLYEAAVYPIASWLGAWLVIQPVSQIRVSGGIPGCNRRLLVLVAVSISGGYLRRCIRTFTSS